MSAVRLPNHIEEKLRHAQTVWDSDTVFLATKRPLQPTHYAMNNRLCAMVDGRFVYTDQREDGGYDAVGGINLPATLIHVDTPALAAV